MAVSTLPLLSPNAVNDAHRRVDNRTADSMQLFDSQRHGRILALSLGYACHRVLLSSNSVENAFRCIDGTSRSTELFDTHRHGLGLALSLGLKLRPLTLCKKEGQAERSACAVRALGDNNTHTSCVCARARVCVC